MFVQYEYDTQDAHFPGGRERGMHNRIDTQVLIVGGGPVGLTLTIDLGAARYPGSGR